MRYHAFHFSWLIGHQCDQALLIGIVTGRVSYRPSAEWLYRFTVFLLIFRIEFLWTTRERTKAIYTA